MSVDLHLRPLLPIYDILNRATGNVVHPAQLFFGKESRSKMVSDFSYLPLGKFSSAVSLAFAILTAILTHFIRYVIRVSSKPKMGWITAGRVVALVKHAQAAWYGPSGEHPRYSVRQKAFLVNPHRAVSKIVASAGPDPAFIWAASINPSVEVSQLAFGKLDLRVGIRHTVNSFIHKFLYVEVRARAAGRTVAALAFYLLNSPRSQAS